MSNRKTTRNPDSTPAVVLEYRKAAPPKRSLVPKWVWAALACGLVITGAWWCFADPMIYVYRNGTLVDYDVLPTHVFLAIGIVLGAVGGLIAVFLFYLSLAIIRWLRPPSVRDRNALVDS